MPSNANAFLSHDRANQKKENSNKLLFFEEEDEMYIIKIIYSLFLLKSCGISQFHGEKDSATMTMWTSS